jgi:DNA-directed RNA polymerase specialized sigma24 family protein
MADEKPVTELRRRANRRDKAAFNELLAGERDGLKKYCLHRLGPYGAMLAEKASEITQSALRITAKKWSDGEFTIRSREELSAFLKKIASAKVASLCRDEKRRREIKAPATMEQVEAQTTSSESADHRKVVVNRVIQGLEDPLERDIAALLCEGYQYKDIPSRLSPKHGKVTPYKVKLTREKLERRLKRADSTFRSR